MKLSDHNPNIEAIGFVIDDEGIFEFVNPCKVPLEFLEDAIKKHKKKKPKKGEVTSVGFINIPFPIDVSGKETKTWGKKKKLNVDRSNI